MLDSQLNYAWQWNCHSPDDMKSNHLLGVNMTDQEMIQEIRKHAEALYSKGWDVFVECWTDADILDLLIDLNWDVKTTLNIMQSIADLHLQRRDEQRADVVDFGEIPTF